MKGTNGSFLNALPLPKHLDSGIMLRAVGCAFITELFPVRCECLHLPTRWRPPRRILLNYLGTPCTQYSAWRGTDVHSGDICLYWMSYNYGISYRYLNICHEQPGDGPLKYSLRAPHTELAAALGFVVSLTLQTRELREGKSLTQDHPARNRRWIPRSCVFDVKVKVER